MTIAVIDYGLGNLQSLMNALEHLGYQADLIDSYHTNQNFDHMFIPGVGAYGAAMEQMFRRGLIETVRHHVEKQRPLMGICLGMQLLVDNSNEFGEFNGLGLIPGNAKSFERMVDENTLIPHMGWNQLNQINDWNGTILQDVKAEVDDLYFVHSFMVQCQNEENRLASCSYGGITFDCVIQKDNIVGTQFHPEKSAGTGLKMLEYFLQST